MSVLIECLSCFACDIKCIKPQHLCTFHFGPVAYRPYLLFFSIAFLLYTARVNTFHSIILLCVERLSLVQMLSAVACKNVPTS